MIKERKALREAGLARETADISKRIQREIRAISRARKKGRIGEILREFKDLKFITGIKSDKKKSKTASMTDKTGSKVYDRQEVANVFAYFYADLYSRKTMEGPVGNPFRGRESEERRISEGEIRKQLEKMARKKAADGSGVVVEMLQAGREELLEAVAVTYNELMKEDAMVPSDWMMTRLIVIFKKREVISPCQRTIVRLQFFQFCTNCSVEFCANG